jgi:hypothetical protein
LQKAATWAQGRKHIYGKMVKLQLGLYWLWVNNGIEFMGFKCEKEPMFTKYKINYHKQKRKKRVGTQFTVQLFRMLQEKTLEKFQ